MGKNEIIFFDCEYNHDKKIYLYGFLDCYNNYFYFTNANEALYFLISNKIKRVYTFNLNIDLGILLLNLNFFDPVYINFNRSGLVNANIKGVYFFDIYFHLPFSIKKLGEWLGLKKLEIDYDFNEINDNLLLYNRRDLEILKFAFEKIFQIYINEGDDRVRSTPGAQALEIYRKKFFCGRWKDFHFSDRMKDMFYTAYYGGEVKVFQSGEYEGEFFKIDINSLFPYIMRMEYPYPAKKYMQIQRVKPKEGFYLIFCEKMGAKKFFSNFDEDYIREGWEKKYYIIFQKICFPFRNYVDYFYVKKNNSKGIEKEIYKRLLNSLYGKFAQRGRKEMVIKIDNDKIEKFLQNKKCEFFEEYETPGYYRICFKDKYPYWANIIFSMYTTNRARIYMKKMREEIVKRGLKIFYQDTDGLIISGNLDKIKDMIDERKIGKFKVVGKSSYINIIDKKQYQFGDELKCKGIPEKYRKEFFEKKKTEFQKFTTIKEWLRGDGGKKVGEIKKVIKIDKKRYSCEDDFLWEEEKENA